MPGVPLSVMPTKPTFTPPISRIAYGEIIGSWDAFSTTFAARYLNFAPRNPSPSWQPSTGWQPPFWSRLSSSVPSSNSWLPTELICRPTWLSASIDGSSWKAALTSGLAPTRSPAPTVSVELLLRSFLTVVARYSAPPAGVPLTLPPLPVGGSMAPWKSLNDSSWPVVVLPLPFSNDTFTGESGFQLVSWPAGLDAVANGSVATIAAPSTGSARRRYSRPFRSGLLAGDGVSVKTALLVTGGRGARGRSARTVPGRSALGGRSHGSGPTPAPYDSRGRPGSAAHRSLLGVVRSFPVRSHSLPSQRRDLRANRSLKQPSAPAVSCCHDCVPRRLPPLRSSLLRRCDAHFGGRLHDCAPRRAHLRTGPPRRPARRPRRLAADPVDQRGPGPRR